MAVQTKTADGADQFTDQLTMPPENIMDVSITLSSDFVGEVQLQRRRPGQDFTKTVSYTDEETGEEVEYEVDLLKHEWR
jgi:hypothetical protein